MSKDKLDLIGVGNAIVDVLSKTEDSFLEENKLDKGIMTLIEAPQAESLYSKMGPAMEMSGGSAANTIASFASLGGKAGFIGKLANDQLGTVFRHDIRSIGVDFETKPLNHGAPTARCLILITSDAQRTMCTNLGASALLTTNDIDRLYVERGKILYLEGYLFDKRAAKDAFYKAAEIAHEHGAKVALTLSDPFCVDRHRKEFVKLVEEHVDILFANEEEIKSLYNVGDIFSIKPRCEILAITRSEKGSVIFTDRGKLEIPAEPIHRLVDTTGAGDAYAAGFLYGYTKNYPLEECGRIASLLAADIIQQMGARTQTNLKKLLKDNNIKCI